ncbi:MAG: helicase-exonuclease AddAB subunit AddA [Lachnospiraceae bacterium]|nr:helicase-exonuclease AddAB subunit AddA [Lachnospiraceae bacterium]
MSFTEEQLRAIEAKERNILVSAAAGSGKTRVLVERIIRRILEGENPPDIDRLLVVTFTEAAAAQMRERIGDAIEKKLSEDPENAHLQKQASLLYRAQISTIHSFCLSVLRNHFQRIGLDPAFRVADETELKLLSSDVLDELFEEKYAAKDPEFLYCVEYFTKGFKDGDLGDSVLKLAGFSEGYPWPEEWLADSAGQYEITDVTEFDGSRSVKYLMAYAAAGVKDALRRNEEAQELSREGAVPEGYRMTLREDRALLEELDRSTDYPAFREKLYTLKFPTLSRKGAKGSDAELCAEVKKIRDGYKEIINGKGKGSLSELFLLSPEEELDLRKGCVRAVRALTALTSEFRRRFREKKLSKGLIGFSDMEHYALEILYDDTPEGKVPSEAADEIREGFDEILMDEYQDCNRVQEMIIESISGGPGKGYNRFMVGDVKQSIYRFRLASPELFIEKYRCYQTIDRAGEEDLKEERINLHKNFRSRKSVINTVNDLFGQIMHEGVGGVEYDEDARLTAGKEFPELSSENADAGTGADDRTEFLLALKEEGNTVPKGEIEAAMIAERIRTLKKTMLVTDEETGELRPVCYRDMVILLRSMTDVASGIKRVFSREGIPFYMTLNAGFYDTTEIRTIVQVLKTIDNPLQEIPLYGTLRSFFGGFTDAELAALRAADPVKNLYENLKDSAGSHPKAERFLSFLSKYRELSAYTPIHELIIRLVNETGYLDYAGAMKGGAQRRANIRYLIAKASAYEQTSYRGLFHFLRYLKELKRMKSDEGEASALDENADVVRIMTIHKSKGLEFPVCFVAGMHKKFNLRDVSGNLIIDMGFGLGVSCFDPALRVRVDPLERRITALKMRTDMVGEELRVLYVAMTRAKEKLIITGVVPEKEGEKIAENCDEVLSLQDISNAPDFLTLLTPLHKKILFAKAVSPEKRDLLEASEHLGIAAELLKAVSKAPEADREAAGAMPEDTGEEEKYRFLKERFQRKYPHEELRGLIQKTSVSELKKAYLDLDQTVEMFPEKESGADKIAGVTQLPGSMSATDRGSAYHKVMELLDFSNGDIKAQFNKFVWEGLITEEWIRAVSEEKIRRFLAAPIASRMAAAQRRGDLKKEQPFVLGISADRVNPAFPKEETILLQGIIDAFFIEDGRIIVLDYKTDVIKNGEELRKRYHIQLDYYAEALERILGLPVTEKLLYSFHLGEVCPSC